MYAYVYLTQYGVTSPTLISVSIRREGKVALASVSLLTASVASAAIVVQTLLAHFFNNDYICLTQWL